MFHAIKGIKARYSDADGAELPTSEGAAYTQVGDVRTRRDGPPQRLVDGKWVDVADPPRTGSR